jgi:hypothetical protein
LGGVWNAFAAEQAAGTLQHIKAKQQHFRDQHDGVGQDKVRSNRQITCTLHKHRA